MVNFSSVVNPSMKNTNITKNRDVIRRGNTKPFTDLKCDSNAYLESLAPNIGHTSPTKEETIDWTGACNTDFSENSNLCENSSVLSDNTKICVNDRNTQCPNKRHQVETLPNKERQAKSLPNKEFQAYISINKECHVDTSPQAGTTPITKQSYNVSNVNNATSSSIDESITNVRESIYNQHSYDSKCKRFSNDLNTKNNKVWKGKKKKRPIGETKAKCNIVHSVVLTRKRKRSRTISISDIGLVKKKSLQIRSKPKNRRIHIPKTPRRTSSSNSQRKRKQKLHSITRKQSTSVNKGPQHSINYLDVRATKLTRKFDSWKDLLQGKILLKTKSRFSLLRNKKSIIKNRKLNLSKALKNNKLSSSDFRHFFNVRHNVRYNRQYVLYPAYRSLDPYFSRESNGERESYQQSMNIEMLRIHSFATFPSGTNVRPLALARSGFFFTGERDIVRCYSCGAIYKDWKNGDKPDMIHRRISPNCHHIAGNDNTNSPISFREDGDETRATTATPQSTRSSLNNARGDNEGEIFRDNTVVLPYTDRETDFPRSNNHSLQQQDSTCTQQVLTRQQSTIDSQNEAHNNEHMLPENNGNQTPITLQSSVNTTYRIRTTGLSNTQMTSTTQSNPRVVNSTELSVSLQSDVPTVTNTDVPVRSTSSNSQPLQTAPLAEINTHVPLSTPSTSQQSQPANVWTTNWLQSTPHNMPPTADQQPTSNNNRNATIERLTPIGVSFERPKYPNYAVMAVRMSSFRNGWPCNQTPKSLAEAGFFFVGNLDYVRCFFCGGGLKNWEDGDDPWVEHARWFPKCIYLHQNKGINFINLVQEVANAETSENVPNCNVEETNQSQSAANRNCSTDNHLESDKQPSLCSRSPKDMTSHPAYESVKDTGYSDEQICSAIKFLQDRGTKRLKAVDILDVIFQREEGADLIGQNMAESAANNDVEAPEDEEMLELVEENRRLKEERLCRICWENDACIVMLPCGHLSCCNDCAPAMRKCPICEAFVKGQVRTWLT